MYIINGSALEYFHSMIEIEVILIVFRKTNFIEDLKICTLVMN